MTRRAGLLAIAMVACGRSSPPNAPVALAVPPAAIDCRSVHAPAEPDLVGWDAWSREQLTALPERGVVAVRYATQGCTVELEVLPNCLGGGRYEYVPYPLDATESKIAHSREELYTKLPIGATSLGPKLEAGRVLRAELTFVGARTLSGHATFERADLTGSDCARATHVVTRIEEGSFVMNVSDEGAASPELIDRGGDAAACDRARAERKEYAQCAVPLRLGLLPITAPPARFACDERDPTPDAMPTTAPPAAYTRIDAKIRRTQGRPSKYVYSGHVMDVLGDGKSKKGALAIDLDEAMALARQLENEVVENDESPEWSVVALTREAEVFERIRDGFANLDGHLGSAPAPPGKIALLTPQQVQLIAALQRQGLGHKTTQLQGAALDFWKAKKQQELDGVETQILTSYARAAKSAQTKNPAAIRAIRRLAHYTRLLGNPRMAKLLGRRYEADMFSSACADLNRPASP